MKAILFKVAQFNDKINAKYPANSLLITPDKLAEDLKEKYVKQGKPNVVEVANINHFFPNFNVKRHPRHPILFLRTGGIGDIFAFSTLFKQLDAHKIIFATQTMYNPCFSYFERPPDTVREVTRAAFENVTFARLRTHLGNIRYANYEGFIENFQKDNWYKIFMEGIGLDYNTELARPQLKHGRPVPKSAYNGIPSERSMIITYKASAAMRTADLEVVLRSIEQSAFRDWKLFIHEVTLDGHARAAIERSPLKVKIIPDGPLYQCLLDWYDAAFVLSVDTGAIHFREGVGKPALGVYGAFHPNARTDTYKNVFSSYFGSLCPHQPCFLHETQEIKTCIAGTGLSYAPCLSMKLNPEFGDQLTHALNHSFLTYSFS